MRTNTPKEELLTFWNKAISDKRRSELISEYFDLLAKDQELFIEDIETIYIYEMLAPQWWTRIMDAHKDLLDVSPAIKLSIKHGIKPPRNIRDLSKRDRGNIYIKEVVDLRLKMLQVLSTKTYYHAIGDESKLYMYSEVYKDSQRTYIIEEGPLGSSKKIYVTPTQNKELINSYLEKQIQEYIQERDDNISQSSFKGFKHTFKPNKDKEPKAPTPNKELIQKILYISGTIYLLSGTIYYILRILESLYIFE